MNWNKLVTETRCEVEERDYEGSMDACMELLEEYGWYRILKGVGCPYVEVQVVRGQGYVVVVSEKNINLAIIKAFLKSNGVATDIAECEACPELRGCEEYLGNEYCNERRNQND